MIPVKYLERDVITIMAKKKILYIYTNDFCNIYMTTWKYKIYLNNLIIPIALCAMLVTSGFSSWTVEI